MADDVSTWTRWAEKRGAEEALHICENVKEQVGGIELPAKAGVNPNAIISVVLGTIVEDLIAVTFGSIQEVVGTQLAMEWLTTVLGHITVKIPKVSTVKDVQIKVLARS